MGSKRNRSSCSEPDLDLKKRNQQITPIKDKDSYNMDLSSAFQEDIDREKAIREVKEKAPGWFSVVFDFMLRDLARISSQVTQVECNKQEIDRLQKRVTELEVKNQTLEAHVMKLEDYSRKSNLLIRGLAETGPKENICEVVRNFFCNSLHISDTDAIRIGDAHRLGKPPHLNPVRVERPRDVIVCFENVAEKELVWKNRYHLKASPFILLEDFCPATKEKRKQLQPYFRAARRHSQVSKCYLNRDVLVINGTRYTVDSVQSLPYGLDNISLSQKTMKDESGVAFFGRTSFLSNFYPSPIIENGKHFPTVEHLYQFKKASYFNDTETATAILTAKTPIQAKALGYKIKDFDEQLWRQTAVQTMHKACALKFQQNDILADKLRKIKGNIIEANPKDSFFSCGLYINHPDINDPAKWKGQNQLGIVLCKVRDSM